MKFLVYILLSMQIFLIIAAIWQISQHDSVTQLLGIINIFVNIVFAAVNMNTLLEIRKMGL